MDECYCRENDNIDWKAIEEYMKLSDEELDKLLAEDENSAALWLDTGRG